MVAKLMRHLVHICNMLVAGLPVVLVVQMHLEVMTMGKMVRDMDLATLAWCVACFAAMFIA